MSPEQPYIRPLPRRKRRIFFFLLLFLFVCSIPFLYLHATGYRFAWKERMNFLISTGGLFVAAEQTGVEIYIDDELVRETRVFRKAYYAQNIDPGTHRIHVQKEGYHTWVKELPVYPHLVSEVQAFNLPVVPTLRPITRYKTVEGVPVVMVSEKEDSLIVHSSTTEPFIATSSMAIASLVRNQEFNDLLEMFHLAEATSTARTRSASVQEVKTREITALATTSATSATTTRESGNVRLFEDEEGDVYASWVGPRDGMPYYYCAQEFDLLPKDEQGNPIYADISSSSHAADEKELALVKKEQVSDPEVGPQQAAALPDELLNPPIQTVPEGEECIPDIRIDRKGQAVDFFDFFPGSTDLVVMDLERGIYAVEIDDRSWQNTQPILEGEDLRARVINGHVVVYDGSVFYEVYYQ